MSIRDFIKKSRKIKEEIGVQVLIYPSVQIEQKEDGAVENVEIVSCDGVSFFVEEKVISAASSYVDRLLRANFKESQEKLIRLDLIRSEVLEVMIEYCKKYYAHSLGNKIRNLAIQFEVKPHLVMELAVYSNYLEMEGLCALTLKMLSHYIDDVPPLDDMPLDLIQGLLERLEPDTLLRAEMREDIKNLNVDTESLWKKHCLLRNIYSDYQYTFGKPNFPIYDEIVQENIFEWVSRSQKKVMLRYIYYLLSVKSIIGEYPDLCDTILKESDTYILTNYNVSDTYSITDYSFLKKLIVKTELHGHWVVDQLKNVSALHMKYCVHPSTVLSFIRQNTGIQILELNKLNLDDKMVILLTDSLQDYDIHSISFSNNKLSWTAFNYLCSLRSPNFTHLDLSKNPLSNTNFIPNLKTSRLKHLNLSSCRYLARKQFATNLDFLWSSLPDTIESLNISHCMIDIFSIAGSDFIDAASKLRYLDLSYNTLETIGSIPILLNNESSPLRCLNLSHNRLHLSHTLCEDLFSHSHKIAHLDISHNGIEDTSISKIIESLSEDTTAFKALFFHGNQMQLELMEELRSFCVAHGIRYKSDESTGFSHSD